MCLFAVFFDFGVFLIHMMAVQHTSLTLMDCSLRRSSLLTILHTYMEHICFASSLRFSDDNYKNAATFKKILKLSCKLTSMRGKLQILGENCIALSGRDLFMLPLAQEKESAFCCYVTLPECSGALVEY